MKALKFANNLVPLILNGNKTTTWRLFDDKDLTTGDNVVFLDHDKNKPFAHVELTDVKETTFRSLTPQDKVGHENYATDEEMLESFSNYYKIDVNLDSSLKIIKYKLL